MPMKSRPALTMALAAAGLLVSLYLLTVHWGWWQAVCLGVGDCEAVNTSIYSELLGIPVALLGAFSYAAIILLNVGLWSGRLDELAARAQFFLVMLGVLFSAYLTYVELFVLHTVCPWCVISAVLISAILLLSLWTLRDTPAPDQGDSKVA
jgi:uncharacterized membrane protein